MNFKYEDINEGDVVEVMSNFGRGPLVRGKVVDKERGGKNGYDVIDYENGREENDEPAISWAYFDQIVCKVSLK